MSRGYRGIAWAGLTTAALCLLSAVPAAAICSHPAPVYNTGTLTGTGLTCTEAQTNLQVALSSAATFNCIAIYGSNADYDLSTYMETLNSCQPNGVGKQETGSASYKCLVCN